MWKPELGAILDADKRCHFCLWSPEQDTVKLHLLAPENRFVSMQRDCDGYHRVSVENVEVGTRYQYQLVNGERPDPASRFQSEGVQGPSQVVSRMFEWTDHDWYGISLTDYIFYELHVGTFTPEGTFDAVIPHLDMLKTLGISALEVMPIAQFPGERDWGYDGVDLFAVQNSYGGPDGFKRLVDACHQRGLAVVLDVVYNHVGAEGNYLAEFGPYFSEQYKAAWGQPFNFDGPYSDHVRRFFIENALYWISEFHVDALRLDATHALFDFAAYTFLEELAAAVHQQAEVLRRRVYVIAENDRSDDYLLRSAELGGYGLDAQWSDDLHHVLHTLLTGENFGYYEDFGDFPQLVRALRNGFVYAGQYSPFRKRRHGTFGADLPAERFVVCSQNHDQVGNRMNGERLSALVSLDELKLAAAVVLLSPYLPLLFMGEEYSETAPFLFFTSFDDPELQKAVGEGRRKEFEAYNWQGEPPNPQDEATFTRSKLDHTLRGRGQHKALQDLYTELIRLRKTIPALKCLAKEQQEVIGYERERVVFAHRWDEDSHVVMIYSFNEQSVTLTLPFPLGRWTPILQSSESAQVPDWDKESIAELTLPPFAFAVFVKESGS
jgi:maltooligosyltrehalose trehalohydrolase